MTESPQMPNSEVESNYPRLTKRQLAVLSLTEEEQVRTARLLWLSSVIFGFIPGLVLIRKSEQKSILHYHAMCSLVAWTFAYLAGAVGIFVYHFYPCEFTITAKMVGLGSFTGTLSLAIYDGFSIRSFSTLQDRSMVSTTLVRWIAYKFSGRGD